MIYAIVNGAMDGKLYLKSIDRGMCASWSSDGWGQLVCKVKRIPKKETGKEKGLQIVGRYTRDLEEAQLFRNREDAERVIQENSVLRYCRVEEVKEE